jgi:SpoVK/Ycf46/Vps4 family AAA+-type ATPase
METSNFLEILDKKQKKNTTQYSEYSHFIRMCDYHYSQQQLNMIEFCNDGSVYYNQTTNHNINQNIHQPIHHNINNVPFLTPSSTLLSEVSHKETSREPSTKSPIGEPDIIPVKTKHVVISTDISSISDLLDILEIYPYESDTEYNIDLQSLMNIKEELVSLNNMIGLQHFKEQILDQLLYFVQDLHKDSDSDFMHTVLCGPPGTGKTEIATILGKMYSKLGILKKNIFKTVNRSDLVAGYLGQTAIKTKKVIEESLGGCLFIDEAYSLANNYEGDSFSRECIDTLCEALSKHKGELMVIIAGYKQEIEQNFFKANKGLNSRFIWRFHLEKYDCSELVAIFNKKVCENNWVLTIQDDVLLKWFKMNHKTFRHYGRDIEQLFSYIKMSHGRRVYGKEPELRKRINVQDLERGFTIFNENNEVEEKTQLFGLYV